MDADNGLQHNALLRELRIGNLAETATSSHLARADQSLVAHLKRFVTGIDEGLLDNWHELLDRLDIALDYLDQQS